VLLRYAPHWSANGLDGDAVEGAKGPYHFASTYVEYVRHEPPAGLTTGWWRGVGPTHNVYALECFLDELALAAGKDPVAFRLALIADPRAKAVLELAAEKAEWGRTLPARSGLGVAVMEAFGSYAATVAEVVVGADGRVRITRLVTAIDCGIAVHPDGVVAQVHSGEVYGVTALLHGRITIENGRVQQSNFHDYPSLRLNEMPAIDVHIVPSQANVGGMGEVGTAVVKPAVLNAVHAATGKRLRTYPIDPVQLRVG
jgi:CO/xanthine dehydrogenase Mo-binding subunit